MTWNDIKNEAWACEGGCAAEDEDEDDVDAGASFNPSVAAKLMARAVPRHAWPFAAILLMQIGDMVADALRVAVWKSTSELGPNVASMAWGARNLISTQARRAVHQV